MPRAAKVLLSVAGTVVGLFLLAFGASFVLNSSDVPRGVSVAGADIGGQSETEAREDVQRALRARLDGPVRLTVDGSDEELALDPRTAGLALDLDATLDDATSSGPIDRVKGLFGVTREVDPQARVDEEALRSALADLAEDFDRALQPGAVTFAGTTPRAVDPASGRTLDVDGAVEAVVEDWLESETVEVPGEVTEPETTPEQVQEALERVARPAVAGDLTLTTDEGDLVLTPADTASVLRLVPGAAGPFTPSVNGSTLLERLGVRVEQVERSPEDASFEIEGGKPVLVPARAGFTVKPTVLSAAVRAAIASPDRSATMELTREEPEITNAKARSLGIKEEIGTFTTFYPCCAPRVTNIQRIAELTDGDIVLPGETYSLNETVGPRTRAKGFVDAPQISRGEFVDGVGGGISQFTTTMYNATFFAGLEDVEHTPHSYYISRYPEGREATITFPAPDLKWKNDSSTGVLITTRATGTSVTVTLYGTERYDEVLSLSSGRSRIREPQTERRPAGPDCSSSSGRSGFDITITRVMKNDGREVKRTRAFHRYLAEPNIICVAARAPEPTSSPSPVQSPSQ